MAALLGSIAAFFAQFADISKVIDAFGFWLFCLTLILFLLPTESCIEWYRRNSSEGYPSVGLVWAIVAFSLWLYYGRLKGDPGMAIVNGIGLGLHIFYTLVYDFFHDDKKHLHYQLAVAAVTLSSAFMYIWELPQSDALVVTGRICTTFQALSCLLGFYGIYYTIKIKTTEYMPFRQTAFGAFVCFNALIFSFLVKDIYMILSNLFNACLTCVSFSMYFIYPPKTWQLPWQRTKAEKEKTS